MPTDEVLLQIGTWVLCSSAPPVVTFTIFYLIRSNWRVTMPGRAIAWMGLALSLTLVLSVITAVAGPDWHGREIARIVVLGFVSVSMWRLLYVLLRIQHDPEYGSKLNAKVRSRARGRGQQS